MKISELQSWLETQKSLHGDIELVCCTSFGNLAEQEFLSVGHLSVVTAQYLQITQRPANDKIVTIGLSD
ncbi:hypothetical protein [Candidatus Pantoea formicae]|uniref:hypothetical protein n=1 Tax=Candidatus Pantoea formicae TaxID=2608355 RepID=UPI003ED9D134